MSKQHLPPHHAADIHNHVGCPFWNQTLEDAVLEFQHVLARIEALSLSPELLGELRQLQLKYASAEQGHLLG